MKRNKKGQVTIYLTFMGVAFLLVVIAGLLAPAGVLFNSKIYEKAEEIYLDANETIKGINDDAVRNQIQTSINQGFEAQETNIDINADVFQYSWIVVLVLAALVVFVYVLRIKQITSGGII